MLKGTAASDYLRDNWRVQCSARKLGKLAATGEGPKFYIYNNERLYPFSELDAFAEAKLGPLLSQIDAAPQDVAATANVDAAAEKECRQRREKWFRR
ncbi:hypothetical protein DNX69_07595 [Rhodopseudomonas palustris]|uniref:DNA-binding protein n=1 Tax=Rhodopseudomonas palustris TaxID=1076 RepID=A0A323UJ63_RHOPL|nr:hypothetical protein DNX69_07595 [Rhodopseudomonas palustris]